MKIYITRHGQVLHHDDIKDNSEFSKGTPALSEVGREQARLLGRRLKEMKFKGKIFASPFICTMETAELIAIETGSEIFSWISEAAVLEYPWWEAKQEEYEDVRYRVSLAMEEIRKLDEDVLIVGHEVSTAAAMHYLFAHKDGHLSNCGLTIFDTKEPRNALINCRKHLPYSIISNNKDLLKDKIVDIEVPEELQKEKGLKLLHIGDTLSATYPWYRSLIKAIKPDVIVHTGDMADEIKVGSRPEVRAEYLDRVQILLDILKESGSKVYWVPGNNDLPGEIAQMAPLMEMLAPDTVLSLEGKDICVAHSKEQITKKADIYLYGHSGRYEVWSAARNTPEREVWYLNAMWNVHVCILPQRTLYCLDRPTL